MSNPEPNTLLTKATEVLSKIERWHGEFPPTGLYWDGTDSEMCYAAAYGSNGERDYMRALARDTLKEIRCVAESEDCQVAIPNFWRCFHCDQVFSDSKEAALHFGNSENQKPACLIVGATSSMLEALREVEEELAMCQHLLLSESGEAAKIHMSNHARHVSQLRTAEELGFERGVKDTYAIVEKSLDTLLGTKMDFLRRLARWLEWVDFTYVVPDETERKMEAALKADSEEAERMGLLGMGEEEKWL